jgi:hypothetical protein
MREALKIMTYDIEILRAICDPRRGEERIAGIEYCAGWDDHANMGISVIGAHDGQRMRVFCRDNLDAFYRLAEDADILVSFNGIAFDNKVIEATTGFVVDEGKCFDLLAEMWAADGLGREFTGEKNRGYGLDATCERTFGLRKTGYGGFAPVEWQRGEYGKVIDYCLNDVYLTRRLFDLVAEGTMLMGPNGPIMGVSNALWRMVDRLSL